MGGGEKVRKIFGGVVQDVEVIENPISIVFLEERDFIPASSIENR